MGASAQQEVWPIIHLRLFREQVVVRIVFAFFLILALAAPAVAQTDAKTTQMMNEVIKKAKTVVAYRADVKETVSSKGQTMTSQGTLAVKSPDKMHKTTVFNAEKGRKKEEYIVDNNMLTYIPTLKAAHKIDMFKLRKAMSKEAPKSVGDMVNPFVGLPQNKIRYVETKISDGGQVHVFESPVSATAQSSTSNASRPIPTKVVLWIDPATGMRQKDMVYAQDGSIMIEQTYSNYRLNIQIPDSEFQFSPPPGVQVKDMTETTINNMKATPKKP
jgi:outer membrane lipoprotein-sorting protein